MNTKKPCERKGCNRKALSGSRFCFMCRNDARHALVREKPEASDRTGRPTSGDNQ